jgi:hypothetical protein
MTIRSESEYAQALDRANRLRGEGQSPETSTELAELDAALHAYAQLAERPGTTPGRPAYQPDPDPPTHGTELARPK